MKQIDAAIIQHFENQNKYTTSNYLRDDDGNIKFQKLTFEDYSKYLTEVLKGTYIHLQDVELFENRYKIPEEKEFFIPTMKDLDQQKIDLDNDLKPQLKIVKNNLKDGKKVFDKYYKQYQDEYKSIPTQLFKQVSWDYNCDGHLLNLRSYLHKENSFQTLEKSLHNLQLKPVQFRKWFFILARRLFNAQKSTYQELATMYYSHFNTGSWVKFIPHLFDNTSYYDLLSIDGKYALDVKCEKPVDYSGNQSYLNYLITANCNITDDMSKINEFIDFPNQNIDVVEIDHHYKKAHESFPELLFSKNNNLLNIFQKLPVFPDTIKFKSVKNNIITAYKNFTTALNQYNATAVKKINSFYPLRYIDTKTSSTPLATIKTHYDSTMKYLDQYLTLMQNNYKNPLLLNTLILGQKPIIRVCKGFMLYDKPKKDISLPYGDEDDQMLKQETELSM